MRDRLHMFSLRSGFTLLELLIAIGIVVIITAVSAIGFAGAQKRGRDIRRRSDAESIRSALELSYNQNNVYPISSETYSSDAGWATGVMNTLKIDGYISSVPVDPINDANLKYGYKSTDGTVYCVKILQESNATSDPNYVAPPVTVGSNTYYVLKYGDATECSSL